MLRRLLWMSLLAMVAAGMWFRTHHASTFKIPLPLAGAPWVAIGDSLTAGYGAEAQEAYPSVLGELLGVEVKNLGVNGATSRDGLDRIEDALNLRPGVALLCLGGNDGLQQMQAHRMFANLEAIIDRLHERGTFVVLIGVHSASLWDRNEKGFAKLAKQKKVLYVPDILSGVLREPDLMADAVHPNARGYRVIAERLARVLRPYLN